MNLEIIAHRGFSAIAPENTLAAFELAIAHGADSIEFDVQLSADKVPVIFHDTTLDRLTGSSGTVQEKTLEELQLLDAGKWFSDRFVGERIPTLKEALGVLKNINNFLYFDIKPHCQWSDVEVIDLVKTLQNENVQDKCVITSFNDNFIDQVRKASKDLLVGHIVANEEAYVTQLAKTAANNDNLISTQYQILFNNPALIEKSRSQGVDIVAWTVDSQEDLQKLVDLGVVRIVTNALIGDRKY